MKRPVCPVATVSGFKRIASMFRTLLLCIFHEFRCSASMPFWVIGLWGLCAMLTWAALCSRNRHNHHLNRQTTTFFPIRVRVIHISSVCASLRVTHSWQACVQTRKANVIGRIRINEFWFIFTASHESVFVCTDLETSDSVLLLRKRIEIYPILCDLIGLIMQTSIKIYYIYTIWLLRLSCFTVYTHKRTHTHTQNIAYIWIKHNFEDQPVRIACGIVPTHIFGNAAVVPHHVDTGHATYKKQFFIIVQFI